MDKAFIEELSKTESLDAVITLAKEKGFTLIEEDLKAEETGSEISDDEMAAEVLYLFTWRWRHRG